MYDKIHYKLKKKKKEGSVIFMRGFGTGSRNTAMWPWSGAPSISCDSVCVAHIEGGGLSVATVKGTVPLLARSLFISDSHLISSLFSHQNLLFFSSLQLHF